VSRRQLWRVAALIIVGVAIVGCGASQYHYVADSADNAYFKVPPSWHQVSPSSLQAAEGTKSQQGTYLWSVAYDSAKTPSVSHIFAPSATPVAYSSVLALSSAERNDISFNSMRDLLLPVTAAARKAASADHEELQGFAALSDQVITDGHSDRGIREIFDYDLGTSLETFDLTVMVNSNTTKLYFLLVHCVASCFVANYKQISTVVGSFTVGGGGSG
jgi:hypothetical protein